MAGSPVHETMPDLGEVLREPFGMDMRVLMEDLFKAFEKFTLLGEEPNIETDEISAVLKQTWKAIEERDNARQKALDDAERYIEKVETDRNAQAMEIRDLQRSSADAKDKAQKIVDETEEKFDKLQRQFNARDSAALREKDRVEKDYNKATDSNIELQKEVKKMEGRVASRDTIVKDLQERLKHNIDFLEEAKKSNDGLKRTARIAEEELQRLKDTITYSENWKTEGPALTQRVQDSEARIRTLLDQNEDLTAQNTQIQAELAEAQERLAAPNTPTKPQFSPIKNNLADELSGDAGSDTNPADYVPRAMLDAVQQELEATEAKLSKMTDKYFETGTALQETMDQYSAGTAKVTEDVAAMQEAMLKERGELQAAKKKLKKDIEAQRKDYERRIADLQQEKAAADKKAQDDLATQKQNYDDQIAELQKEKANTDSANQQAVQALQGRIDQLQKERAAADKRAQDDLATQEQNYDDQIAQLQKEREDADTANQQALKVLQDRIAQLEKDKVTAEATIRERDNNLKKNHQQIKDLRDKVNALEKMEASNKAQIFELSGKLKNTTSVGTQTTPQEDDSEKKAEDLQKQLDQAKLDLTRATQQLTWNEAQVSIKGDALQQAEKEAVAHETEINELTEQLVEAQNSATNLQTQLDQAIAALNTTNQQLQDTTNQLQGCQEEKQTLKDEENDPVRVRAKALVNKALDQAGHTIAALDKLERDLDRLATQNPDDENAVLAAVQAQLARCRSDHNDLEAEIAKLNQAIADRDQTIADLTGQTTTLNGQVTDLTGQVTARDQQIANLNTQIERLQALDETVRQQTATITALQKQAAASKRELDRQLPIFQHAQKQMADRVARLQAGQQAGQAQIALAIRRAQAELAQYRGAVDALTAERDRLRALLLAQAQEQQQRAADKNKNNNTGNNDDDDNGFLGGTLNRLRNVDWRAAAGSWPFATLAIVSPLCLILIASVFAYGSAYADWRGANQYSRGLYMMHSDSPALCLSMPQYEYFWHILLLLLAGISGGWWAKS